MRRCLSAALLVVTCSLALAADSQPPRDQRLVVRVEPVDLGRRVRDELPAEVIIDHGDKAWDATSLRVIRVDESGKSLGEASLPFRWYDAAIPYDFPEFQNYASRSAGEMKPERRERGGYYLNAMGDGRKGRLVWMHTQLGNEPAWYAIEFGWLKPGEVPRHLPPQGWIGDGQARCAEHATQAVHSDHLRIDLDDWDGDGAIDVLFGDWFGHVWLHRNRGSAEKPDFDLTGLKLPTSDGSPIKVGPIGLDPNKDFTGLQGARTVVTAGDFDGDKRRDLVVGDTFGKVRFFRQPPDEMRLAKETPVFAPAVEIGDLGIRLNVCATDWNQDGRLDVIAGSANGKVQVFLSTADVGAASPFAAGFTPKLPPIMQRFKVHVSANKTSGVKTMKPATRIPICLSVVALIAGGTPTLAADTAKPNVIFILCDDLGWRDVGCFGSTFHETPHIDRLAARGVRFTQAYAASPLCSPTRSSILTGLYPARIGITSPSCHLPQVQLEKKLQAAPPTVKVQGANSLTRLKTEYVTLAETMRDAGYATAHFGKWHLGHNLPANDDDRYEPRDQGFAFDFPHTPRAAGPGGGYLAPWKFIDDVAINGKPGEHIEDRMSAEAAKYIREHKDQPFYLNYWAFSVHGPWNARGDYIEHFKSKVDPKNPQRNPLYAAMVRSLDDGVGRLLAAVDEAGIAERTIFVFFSDNGGWAYPPRATDPAGFTDVPATSNLPLRSGKASLYEGGTREPCIVVWPGQAKAGSSNDSLLHSTDFHPTLLTMCGLKPPAGSKFDGVDQSGTLLGKGPSRDRFFCHFPHGSEAQAQNIPGFFPGTYVRKGDWKLIRFYGHNDDGSDRLELYNLQDDVGESKNLAAEKPDIARELNGLITGFLRETEAVVPIRNPSYRADAAKPTDSKPKSNAKAAVQVADNDPNLQGWKARNCTAVVKDGIVTITGKNGPPFLGVGAGTNGPVVVKLKTRCTNGGDGKIEWLAPNADAKSAKSVPFTIKPGEWQEVTVEVPAEGAVGILRVHVPAQKEAVEIDWIELKTPAKIKRWEF